MKAQSRKFLTCMFCGTQVGLTREHIFGDSISRRFPAPRLASVPRRSNAPPIAVLANDMERRYYYYNSGMAPLAFTSHSMCGECNHRLGQEFTDLIPALAKLFSGRTNKIPDSLLRTAIRYFQRIGILVDLESSIFDPILMTESEKDIATNSKLVRGPSFLTQAERVYFLNGAILPNISVFLGKHYGEYGRQMAMTVVRCEDGHLLGPERNGSFQKKFIFAIEKVTALIVVGRTFDINTNQKLKLLDSDELSFSLNPKMISSDADIELNLALYDNHLDGSFEMLRGSV